MTGNRRDGFVLVRVVGPGAGLTIPLFRFASGARSPARDRADHGPGHDRDDQRGPSRREDPMDLHLLRVHHSEKR
jgi:hypothetical protein